MVGPQTFSWHRNNPSQSADAQARALAVVIGLAVALSGAGCLRDAGRENDATPVRAPSSSASGAAPVPASASVSVGSVSTADATTSSSGTAPSTPNRTPPDIDSLPWEAGGSLGVGIARKDTQNPKGENVLVAWAGWKVSLEAAEIWATELYRASLETRGVRWIFAVQGPKHPLYRDHEIGSDKLAAALVPIVSGKTQFIVGVAHSSGALVAHELFDRLSHGADPLDKTAGRIVYFNLDGEKGGLDPSLVSRLRRAYFVGAYDSTIDTASHEDGKMRQAAKLYPNAGGYVRQPADGSGCERGAGWCMHMTLVTTKPHDPRKAKEIDFRDFRGREVATGYLESKAADAGLNPP